VNILKYRLLGKTGLSVSELGFGCGAVGGLLVRGDRYEILRTVERAIKLGVNYFDTATIYGNGKSESNLGTVLSELGRDIIVGTKVRLTGSEMSCFHDSVTKSVEESLKRLKLDCIDLIQLHNRISLNRDPERGYVGIDDINPIISTFQSLQDQGKIKFYGINGLGETEVLHQAIDTVDFHSLQTCYNMINPSSGNKVPQNFPFQNFQQLIQKASVNGIGVITIRVLAGGALSGNQRRHPNAAKTVSPIASRDSYEDDVITARMFQFLVDQDYTNNLIEAAIRFVISNSMISTALVGFSNLGQLNQAVKYVDKGPLPHEALNQIEEIWYKLTK
jgi:L-galactose dehydrogenase/L-glyceraldehyde 3-phosphate reductase